MTNLEQLEQYLAEDLEQRRGGGESCPVCEGKSPFPGFIGAGSTGAICEACPDCKGTGKSPAIKAAADALELCQNEIKAVDRLVKSWEAECKLENERADEWYGRAKSECHAREAAEAELARERKRVERLREQLEEDAGLWPYVIEVLSGVAASNLRLTGDDRFYLTEGSRAIKEVLIALAEYNAEPVEGKPHVRDER